MKTRIAFIGLLAAGISACAAPPADTAPHGRVQVHFVNPEKFTDISDNSFPGSKGRASCLRQLENHLVRQADRRLPPGSRMSVSITDIDRAGDTEPWRGTHFQDLRIVKDIYPPRIDLSFRVTNAMGEVIAGGNRKLRNVSYMADIRVTDNDPLRYEKALLDDWLQRDLPPA